MPKAARVLAALKRMAGSRPVPRVASRSGQERSPAHLAYHDDVDLGGPAMARTAEDYVYTLAELRKL
jgi:hypothetical protein